MPSAFFLGGPDAEITVSAALSDDKLSRLPTWSPALNSIWVVFKHFHVVLFTAILASPMLSEFFGDSSFPDYGSVKNG